MAAPKLNTEKAGGFLWWEGTDLADLIEELTRRGLDNVRLELHMDSRLFFVRDKGAAPAEVMTSLDGGENPDGFNYSHQCPPECP